MDGHGHCLSVCLSVLLFFAAFHIFAVNFLFSPWAPLNRHLLLIKGPPPRARRFFVFVFASLSDTKQNLCRDSTVVFNGVFKRELY